MSGEQVFATRFYQTPSGDEPVRDFLRSLPKEARAKCGRYMEQLEWRGLSLSAALLKKLAGDIWELRPEYDGIEYRLYFGIAAGQAVYVHAVVKKQQKAARSDIDLARRRFNEWRAAHRDTNE